MEKCIARELVSGDRIQVALVQYLLTSDPDFIDDDRVRLKLYDHKDNQHSLLDVHWQSVLNVVPSPV